MPMTQEIARMSNSPTNVTVLNLCDCWNDCGGATIALTGEGIGGLIAGLLLKGTACGLCPGWLPWNRAVAKACTLAKRCCGSFASALSTTHSKSSERADTWLRSEGGISFSCFTAISKSVAPSKG